MKWVSFDHYHSVFGNKANRPKLNECLTIGQQQYKVSIIKDGGFFMGEVPW